MESRLDHRRGSMVLLAVLVSACAAPPPAPKPAPAPVVVEPVVPERLPALLFGSNETTLLPDQRRQVRAIAATLKEPHVAERAVRVEGHTDALGDSALNQRISLQRARAVANELVFNGVSPERLTVVGLGDTQPTAPNTEPDGSDNPQGRSLNRRVEVVIEAPAE